MEGICRGPCFILKWNVGLGSVPQVLGLVRSYNRSQSQEPDFSDTKSKAKIENKENRHILVPFFVLVRKCPDPFLNSFALEIAALSKTVMHIYILSTIGFHKLVLEAISL